MEPQSTATLLLIAGVLIVVAVLFGRMAGRIGVPLLLIFLVVGMLTGSDGLVGIPFDDYGLAYRIGTAALVLILFDGGLQTPAESLRRALLPAGLLASVGVVATAGLVAVAARICGLGWGPALILGAMVSSTDAAAVFSVLRGSGLQLRRRAGTTLEVESGINDPMAVILTTVLAGSIIDAPSGWAVTWAVLWQTAVQMAVGIGGGLLVGWGGSQVLARVPLGGGLAAVFTLAIAFIAYGLTSIAWGSGFLAVYLAGLVLGNRHLPYRGGLLRVHDAAAWLSQVVMFLLLGLLAFPHRLGEVLVTGIAIALVLAVVIRPLVVAAILVPLGFSRQETTFVGWVGLRGAVPIVLATVPLMMGVPDGDRLFNIVFVVVIVSALLPGATVPWITRRLGIAARTAPLPRATVDVNAATPIAGAFSTWFVQELSPVAGMALRDIDFPEDCAVLLVVRGEEVLPARGSTTLQPGDHVTIYSRGDHTAFLVLAFGKLGDDD